MDFRTRRQLVVLAILAAFFIVVGGTVVYRLLPAPTCFDNRQNQGEAGMDCGGPCIPCALAEAKPIEVFWVRFVKTREGTYDVAAELKNPNAALGAKTFDYEFKLHDTAGVVVAVRRGRSFLYPGELAHLIEVGLVSGRVLERASLAISNPEWVVSEAGPPDLIAGGKEHSVESTDGTLFSLVRASLSNRASADIPEVRLGVLLFDSDGNLVGASATVLERIRAGEVRPVAFRWPVSFGDRVASITVEPRIPLVPQ